MPELIYEPTIGIDVVQAGTGPVFASRGTCWWTSRESDLHFLDTLQRDPTRPIGYRILTHAEALQQARTYAASVAAGRPQPRPRLVPCDPTGTLVMPVPRDMYLRQCTRDVSAYGRHALRTWLAAHHGNVHDALGQPAASEDWADYDSAVERWLAQRRGY